MIKYTDVENEEVKVAEKGKKKNDGRIRDEEDLFEQNEQIAEAVRAKK